MEKIIIALALSAISTGAIAADQRVDGYTRKDGTYVEPYHRTAPDPRRDNNYESRGKTNPYTGKEGTRDPYAQPQPRQRRSY